MRKSGGCVFEVKGDAKQQPTSVPAFLSSAVDFPDKLQDVRWGGELAATL